MFSADVTGVDLKDIFGVFLVLTGGKFAVISV